jgi:hypothetical protein
MFENGTAPEEVAKVILKAVTSIIPELRYLVGSDANSLIEKRKSVPEIFARFLLIKLEISK